MLKRLLKHRCHKSRIVLRRNRDMNFFAFFDIGIKILCFFSGLVFLFLSYRLFILIKFQDLLRDVQVRENDSFAWPKVSLIVPVCNEAATVKNAAYSLFSMSYPHIEFIFVNDRSTDDTGMILSELAAHEPRMKVVTVSDLPENWLGKVHAFKKGIEGASGDWILFSDADVHYHKFSLKKAIRYSYDKKLDFLAVLPSIVGGTLLVRILSAQMLHFMTFLVNFSKIQEPWYPKAIAHGAFMLVQKKAYTASKGFEALRLEVLDDVGFATEMKASGARVAVLSGLDEIDFEWYTNLKSFVSGFEKNGFASIQYSRFLLCISVLGIGLFFCSYTLFPILINASFYKIWVWFTLTLYLSMTYKALKKIIHIPFWGVLCFPFTVLVLPYIISRSAIKCLYQNGIYWRGTFYPLSKLKNAQKFKILKDSSQ